jgi:peptide/nickel transport system substrate-binding protein
MWREHIYWSDVGKELYNQANPEKAKQLLKEAGYDGREIRINTNQQYPYMYKSAVSLQAQLKRIGVPARLIVVDWPTQTKMRHKGGVYDIGFTGNTTRFDPSHHAFSLRGRSSYGGINNAKMNELLVAGENETDFKKRYEIYKRIQKLMYDEVLWMRTFDDNNYQVHTTKLKGYKPWYLLRLWNTWLED